MTDPNTPEELDPATAFQAMDRRLAGLTAAVDGLAVKLQEMHGRDYSPELAKIEGQFQKVRGAVKNFIELPAMVLTPEKIAAQIEAAGRNGRQADHEAWQRAQSNLRTVAESIGTVVLSARKEQEQTKWMTIVAGATLVVGCFLGVVGRDVVTRIAPESWHWPEHQAASILGLDEWSAGERLLEVADLQRWLKVKAAIRTVDDESAGAGNCGGHKTNCGKSQKSDGVHLRTSK
ncbi:DUF6118 family protein [Novosphingobium sp. BL-8A]|uniref:DUF6118 family protein n=1 Tax=Novosphingobium sp. BL-8A TaxID=3127639 RepID=UPI003756FB35